MALAQTTSSRAVASGRQSSLLVAKPISQRLCFQSSVRHVQQEQAARRAVISLVASSVGAMTGVQQTTSEAGNGLPKGYHWYETMMILNPGLKDEERDRELAKFEAYLNKEECYNINALVKGRSKLAYPIKREQEGIYVLYTYCAKRQTARAIQLLLSNPEAGAENTVLRHITLFKN